MPAKKANRRKQKARKGPRVGRRFNRPSRDNFNTNAVGARLRYRPGINQTPMPSNFVTEFRMEGDYSIAAATATITSGQVKLDSLHLPLFPAGSAGFPSYTYLGPGASSTVQPTMFSTLCNQSLYQYFKVLKANIQVRATPSATGDGMICVVVPSTQAQTPINIYTARTQPYAKQAAFFGSRDNEGVNKAGFLSQTVNPHALMGFTPLQAEADMTITGNYTADPTSSLVWNVYLQTVDNTGTGANMTFQIRLHWVVELFWRVDPALSVT